MNLSRPILASAFLALALTSAATAQDAQKARRLESVTWNPVDHKLTWVVIDGSLADKGKFEGSRRITFSIDMDEATMSTDGEDRRFSKMEATSVHRLMDMVAKYAAESTLWWEAGEGERLPKDGSGNSRVDQRERGRKHPHDGLIPDVPPQRRRQTEREGKVLKIKVESVTPIDPGAAASATIE
ncbi:MAG TPA: hypothetical protein VES20_10055 [Bryobacteraceae bacterium]|nr:hypothetical protein [Bryobacteraceae bacterium]